MPLPRKPSTTCADITTAASGLIGVVEKPPSRGTKAARRHRQEADRLAVVQRQHAAVSPAGRHRLRPLELDLGPLAMIGRIDQVAQARLPEGAARTRVGEGGDVGDPQRSEPAGGHQMDPVGRHQIGSIRGSAAAAWRGRRRSRAPARRRSRRGPARPPTAPAGAAIPSHSWQQSRSRSAPRPITLLSVSASESSGRRREPDRPPEPDRERFPSRTGQPSLPEPDRLRRTTPGWTTTSTATPRGPTE